MKVEKGADRLFVVRHLTIKSVSVSPEKYVAVRQFYAEIARPEQAQAVFLRE